MDTVLLKTTVEASHQGSGAYHIPTTACLGAVKGAPLQEAFCVFPPAGGDQVGEAVDTPGACAMILIRAPPTMACGTIRRVVLQNEKTNTKNSKHVNGNKNSSNSSSSNKNIKRSNSKNSNSPTSTSVWCWNRKKEQEQLQQQQQQEQRQQQQGRLPQLQRARRRTDKEQQREKREKRREKKEERWFDPRRAGW